jgi:ABC-type branched-subunit amino acid transport system permease subunit
MYTIELLDVVTTAGVLYVVAVGLLIVYGVLKIINLAHGAFLATGAYAAVVTTHLGGSCGRSTSGRSIPSSPPGGSTSSSSRPSRSTSGARSSSRRARSRGR